MNPSFYNEANTQPKALCVKQDQLPSVLPLPNLPHDLRLLLPPGTPTPSIPAQSVEVGAAGAAGTSASGVGGCWIPSGAIATPASETAGTFGVGRPAEGMVVVIVAVVTVLVRRSVMVLVTSSSTVEEAPV